MTKPKKLRGETKIEDVQAAIELQEEFLEANDVAEIVKELLTPKRPEVFVNLNGQEVKAGDYVPPECSSGSCTCMRPEGKRFAEVASGPYYDRVPGYALRYIHCRWCDNTYKHLEKLVSVSPTPNA